MPPIQLATIQKSGKLRLNFHKGQMQAWRSRRRYVCVLAGTQGGKTSFGPHWLYREITQAGPGDYLVVTPTFPLLELKALPEFLRVFKTWLNLGQYVGSPVRKFTFSADGARRTFGFEPEQSTHVFFGYAADPESLESATAQAAWLDEAGQKRFKIGSWEAVLRRLSLARGRVLITTTPYSLGWLKQQLWDKWKAGTPDIDVIRFDSIANPAFPRAEYDEARDRLPRWKFDMFYRAIFSRPAGLIYDAFDEARHKIPRFAIPDSWPRFLGLDFGGVNLAGLFYAQEPGTQRVYLYREYKAGRRTAQEHTSKLLEGEPMRPRCVGGSKSEGQWRAEFQAAGLSIQEPDVSEVEVGIDRVYGAHKQNHLYVFDDLLGYLDEKASYARELDANGEPTEAIEDKETFHFMDAERYILGWLFRKGGTLKSKQVDWYAQRGATPRSAPVYTDAQIEQLLMSTDIGDEDKSD